MNAFFDRVLGLIYEFETSKDTEARNGVLRKFELLHSQENFTLPAEASLVLPDLRKSYAELLFSKEMSAASEFLRSQKAFEFYKTAEYERRSKLELSLARIFFTETEFPIAYVGSGAFPISAISAAKNGFPVELVDRSNSALELARRIFERFGLNGQFTCADATSWQPPASRAFVVISGTVGITEDEKLEIARVLLNRTVKGTLLCFRQPMREEILFMAPLPTVPKCSYFAVTCECENDYTRRVMVTHEGSGAGLW